MKNKRDHEVLSLWAVPEFIKRGYECTPDDIVVDFIPEGKQFRWVGVIVNPGMPLYLPLRVIWFKGAAYLFREPEFAPWSERTPAAYSVPLRYLSRSNLSPHTRAKCKALNSSKRFWLHRILEDKAENGYIDKVRVTREEIMATVEKADENAR